MVNGRFQVFTKAGGSAVQSTTLNQFWASNTYQISNNSFDPRVQFDKSSGHWFASALADGGTAASRYLVAVSNTSDATQGWQAFAFHADPANLARGSGGLGGPLIEGKDPKALAAVLDVDEPFASRIQHAAGSLDEMRGLSDVVARGRQRFNLSE